MSKLELASSARRWRALVRIDKWLEPIMVLLGLTWLTLLVAEFVWGLTRWMRWAGDAIWIVFLLEFLLRYSIAPAKRLFLRRNWLTLIALALPALRVLRVARALRLFRFTRGLKLVRLLTSMNRGLRSLAHAMQKRGAGYVSVLTLTVTFAGAAGMLVFEGGGANAPFSGYAEALWWTAMVVTTLGSDFWPQTPEGRVLTLLLSIYAVGVFGYLAASLASFFIDREAKEQSRSGHREQLNGLRLEIQQLRQELHDQARRSPIRGENE
jgi:voltage-gated potassium channel